MRNILTQNKMKNNNKQKNDTWIKIFLLPFIIGFSLIYANISMRIFKLIGWFLFVFGIITGSYYAYDYYKNNKTKIREFLMKVYLIKRRPISKKENDIQDV